MSIEAMKKLVAAVEAIPEDVEGWMPDALTDALIDAKKSIAESEKHEVSQEPVMGVEVKRIASGGFIGNVWWIHENLQEGVFHLYTHPQPKREWVELTDEEVLELWIKHRDVRAFARAIQALSKEKNT